MKAWITKYALTGGIKIVEGKVDGTRFHLSERSEFYYATFYLGRDAFLTEAEAKAAAGAKRDRKVKSMEKQIKTLKALSF